VAGALWTTIRVDVGVFDVVPVGGPSGGQSTSTPANVVTEDGEERENGRGKETRGKGSEKRGEREREERKKGREERKEGREEREKGGRREKREKRDERD
jgi:hypothetical protein